MMIRLAFKARRSPYSHSEPVDLYLDHMQALELIHAIKDTLANDRPLRHDPSPTPPR